MRIQLTKKGPVHIEASEPVQIKSHDGNGLYSFPSPIDIWLCTCGESKNYPHCDGSHNNDKVMVLPKSNDDGLLSDGEILSSNKEPISKELIDEFNEYLKKRLLRE